MRNCFIALFNLMLLFAMGVDLRAADVDRQFDEANRLYEEGKYEQAAAGYERLARSGIVSSALYYNLGNAWFKAAQLGQAIAAYREAEWLDPRDPELRANLQFAREKVYEGKIPFSLLWQHWLRTLTMNEWTMVASIVGWIWLVILALRELGPVMRKRLAGYVPATTVATALFTILLILTWRSNLTRTSAVVIQKASARYGPFQESAESFALPDGTETTVRDRKGAWLELADAQGRSGWVEREKVIILSSPFVKAAVTPPATAGTATQHEAAVVPSNH